MKVYLVRHAKTEMNEKGLIQGRTDSHVSTSGVEEVLKLKEKIKDKQIDVCYVSPLIRTFETALPLVGDKALIIKDERIIERDLGDMEGRSWKEYNSIPYWDYNKNLGDYNVEKIQDIFIRCKDFIKDLPDDKNILIVSHSAIIRALHHILHNTDLEHDDLFFKIDNCSFEEIEVNKKDLHL